MRCAYGYPDTHLDRNLDLYAHSDTHALTCDDIDFDAGRHIHPNGHTDRNWGPVTDPDTDTHTDADRNINQNVHANSDVDTDSDSDCNRDRISRICLLAAYSARLPGLRRVWEGLSGAE
ncbi:MAG TPA: hypothetical protein PLL45_04910 [Thermoflexales bacterium]|jgi:hypothetical protein|nr:hypothetical protein [Thermoflexales bacterium]HQY24196.1 hypothetical protein [Thermoflexales bacterium]